MRPWSILCALALFGCRATADTEATKKHIREWLAGPPFEAKVSEVSCPDKVEVKLGHKYECAAEVEGSGSWTVTVEQIDDAGHVKTSLREPSIASKRLEAAIQELLAQKGVITVADCGPRLRPSTAGTSFECRLVDAESKTQALVDVTVKDDKGNVDWKPRGGLVSSAEVEKQIASWLRERGFETTVGCGARHRVKAPKTTFSCVATAGDGQQVDVVVTIDDGEGMTFEVKPAQTAEP